MTDTETWPYDALQDDPLTALRIPVTTTHPEWVYLVAFNGTPLWDGDLMDRPDETETRMLASLIDYTREHWFNESYKAKLLKRPFDIDGGHNTLILRKWASGDWAYRRRTWDRGPNLVPIHPNLRKREPKSMGPLTLSQLLDHVHTYGGDKPIEAWTFWRLQHPEVFGDE